MKIIIFVLIMFSATAKATMDTLRFYFTTSIFRNLGDWWNPANSWRMKWKDNLLRKERFPGSSTIFVSFTDAWHFFQHWFLLPLFVIPLIYSQCFPIIKWNYWYLSDFIVTFVSFAVWFQFMLILLRRRQG